MSYVYIYDTYTHTHVEDLIPEKSHRSVHLKGSTAIKGKTGFGYVFAKFEGNRSLRREVFWRKLQGNTQRDLLLTSLTPQEINNREKRAFA